MHRSRPGIYLHCMQEEKNLLTESGNSARKRRARGSSPEPGNRARRPDSGLGASVTEIVSATYLLVDILINDD